MTKDSSMRFYGISPFIESAGFELTTTFDIDTKNGKSTNV